MTSVEGDPKTEDTAFFVSVEARTGRYASTDLRTTAYFDSYSANLREVYGSLDEKRRALRESVLRGRWRRIQPFIRESLAGLDKLQRLRITESSVHQWFSTG
jgi:hypothetical protein